MPENLAVLWLIVGTILLVLEFVVPGVVLLFFGIGAWGVMAVVYFFDIPFVWQLIIFLGISLISLFFLRKWVMQILHRTPKTDAENSIVTKDYIGKTVITQEIVNEQKGSVAFQGSYWQARIQEAGEAIPSGTRVRIVAVETTIFIVEKV